MHAKIIFSSGFLKIKLPCADNFAHPVMLTRPLLESINTQYFEQKVSAKVGLGWLQAFDCRPPPNTGSKLTKNYPKIAKIQKM